MLHRGRDNSATSHSFNTQIRPWAMWFLSLPLLLLTSQARGSDIQMWNEIDLSASLSDRFKITVPLVVRDSFKLDNPQLDGGGVIVDFAATSFLTLSAGDLFASIPNSSPVYNVDVPLGAITLHHTLGPFELSDRNRFEQLINFPDNPVRYRNRMAIDLPLDSGRWTPFVADEFFYDFSQARWTQNRFQIGVGWKFAPNLQLDGYYLERTDIENTANEIHAIGIALEINLTPSH